MISRIKLSSILSYHSARTIYRNTFLLSVPEYIHHSHLHHHNMVSRPSSHQSLKFKVWRCQPELVAPATPTPREIKLLSDIDDQKSLRFHFPMIHIYRNNPAMGGKDPVKIHREALAKTLVSYYPLAGRLRERHDCKLMVDCTAEGVLFVEADADVTLDQFGDTHLRPPFPCFHDLHYDVPSSQGIINCPLILIQVTRLKCGGFFLATLFSHTMMDGSGLAQFMNAWAEMAKGASQPSIPPVWRRELLSARNPPRITFNHIYGQFEQITEDAKNNTTMIISSREDNMVERSFFLGPTEIATLHHLASHHLGQECTKFEVIAACIWYCRSKALQLEPNKEVRMIFSVNARAKFNPPLPIGYYGNCFTIPSVVTTVGKLCGNPFGHAVELIKKTKAEVTEEYIRSVLDLMVIKGRSLQPTNFVESISVSSVANAGFREVDFGWGKAVFGGAAKAGVAGIPGTTFIMSCENAKCEDGMVFPINLPDKAMRRFEKELDDLLYLKP